MSPRRLDIDHLTPARRPRWAGYLLLVLAVLAAGEITQRYREAQLAIERHAQVQGMLNVQRSPVKSVPKGQLDEQVKNAQAVLGQLTLPWGVSSKYSKRRAARTSPSFSYSPMRSSGCSALRPKRAISKRWSIISAASPK